MNKIKKINNQLSKVSQYWIEKNMSGETVNDTTGNKYFKNLKAKSFSNGYKHSYCMLVPFLKETGLYEECQKICNGEKGGLNVNGTRPYRMKFKVACYLIGKTFGIRINKPMEYKTILAEKIDRKIKKAH